MFRKLYVAATILLMLTVMSAAMTGCPDDLRAQYQITLENVTACQPYQPIVTVTHCAGVSVFREGAPALADLVDFVESGDLALIDTLESLDAVTGLYLLEQELTLPMTAGDTATLTILGRQSDLVTVVARPVIDMVDAFVGLDSVPLPVEGSRTYYLDYYTFVDGDVVLDTGEQNLVRVTITRVD